MFGGPGKRYAYPAEHVLQLWVPADPARDWLLDRRTTGARVWLSGTEEQAAADGFGTEAHWPTGRWQTPNTEFLAGVTRDPRLLYERLRRDSPERSGYHGPFTYAADVLRSGLVPPDLRAGPRLRSERRGSRSRKPARRRVPGPSRRVSRARAKRGI